MKIKRKAQRKGDAYTVMVTKSKAFRTQAEAEEWARRVGEILRVAAAAPAMGLSPEAAVGLRFGSGSGVAA